jgi:hypothetical protein
MASVRFRSALVPLFFGYTAAGSLLGVVAYAAIVLVGSAFDDSGTAPGIPPTMMSMLTSSVYLWFVGLIPSGVSALLFCLVMAVWPSVYESRKLRVPIAGLVGAVTTGVIFITLSVNNEFTLRNIGRFSPFIGMGALSAMVLAFRWPRRTRANAI